MELSNFSSVSTHHRNEHPYWSSAFSEDQLHCWKLVLSFSLSHQRWRTWDLLINRSSHFVVSWGVFYLISSRRYKFLKLKESHGKSCLGDLPCCTGHCWLREWAQNLSGWSQEGGILFLQEILGQQIWDAETNKKIQSQKLTLRP